MQGGGGGGGGLSVNTSAVLLMISNLVLVGKVIACNWC